MSKHDVETSREKLSPTQFERLLLGLDPDRDRAGEKYEDLRLSLIRFFDWNSCADAEDQADETLNRVAQRLEKQDILDISAFAWGVAKNIRREVESKRRRLVALDDLAEEGLFLRDNRNIEVEIYNHVEKAQQLECLRLCLKRLPKENRNLFVSYHAAEVGRSEIRVELARVYGLTIGALRMKIIRLREKLEKCAARCVNSSRRGAFDEFDSRGGTRRDG